MAVAGKIATFQTDKKFTFKRYSTIFLCSSPSFSPTMHFLLHCTGSFEVKLRDLWGVSCLQKETYKDPVLLLVSLH